MQGLGDTITACWAKPCCAILDSKHLHSVLVADAISFHRGCVTTCVYLCVFTIFSIEEKFIPYI